VRFSDYIGEEKPPMNLDARSLSIQVWQRYASPVWFDINQMRVLQGFKHATSDEDEKHICPLQLDVIERSIHLWTNPGDTVFSPFTGIGSEGYCAIEMGRKFIGAELKRGYWEQACRNIADAKAQQTDLFATA
jgi:DNA modification methylase